MNTFSGECKSRIGVWLKFVDENLLPTQLPAPIALHRGLYIRARAVQARPALIMTLDLNPRKTALILIDLQQGIVSVPLMPHSATAVVQNAVSLGRALGAAGGVVIPVNVTFSADSADRLKTPVDTPPNLPPQVPPGWADLVPEIAALPAGVRITKRQWSAFYGTELDLQLRRRGIETVLIGGIATNFGVESTARDAWQHNYAVVIAEDACSSSASAELHRVAI